MALDAKRKNLDGLDEKESQHYVEDKTTGEYKLDVKKVDGLGLEDIAGLKSTVEKLRTSEKSLEKNLKTIEDQLKAQAEKFKDINPEAARSALAKIDEIKDWDGETKVKEAVIVAEGRMEAKMRELATQHKTSVDELQSELTNSQDQLQDAIVNSKIIEAIHKEEGNIDLLIPHVKSQVEMVKDSHGVWKPEVINKEGNPRIGDSEGNPMTITQLVQEMKAQDTFAAAFPGANSTGSGHTETNESTTHMTGNEKVIAASDGKAKSKNLEDIAAGKVKVDMSK